MPGDEDFLRAIRARPDDAAMRLVDAGWLEERGELIRLEVGPIRADPSHPCHPCPVRPSD
jgi:uncharacterized protein (TIGR02996 family)